jgi:DUF971 family protein
VLKDKNPDQTKPTELKKLGDIGFRISWKDKHTSEYAFSYLRRLCPCAGCSMTRNNGQDVHSLFSRIEVGDPNEIDVKQDICAVEINLVGRYALSNTCGRFVLSLKMNNYNYFRNYNQFKLRLCYLAKGASLRGL